VLVISLRLRLTWNSIPISIINCSSLGLYSFKRHLKSHLIAQLINIIIIIIIIIIIRIIIIILSGDAFTVWWYFLIIKLLQTTTECMLKNLVNRSIFDKLLSRTKFYFLTTLSIGAISC